MQGLPATYPGCCAAAPGEVGHPDEGGVIETEDPRAQGQGRVADAEGGAVVFPANRRLGGQLGQALLP